MSKTNQKVEADQHPNYVAAVRQIQKDLFKTDRWGNGVLRGNEKNIFTMLHHLNHDQTYQKNSSARQSRKSLRDALFRYAPVDTFNIAAGYLLREDNLSSRFTWTDDRKSIFINEHPYWRMVFTSFEKALADVSLGNSVDLDTLTDEEKARCVLLRLNLQS